MLQDFKWHYIQLQSKFKIINFYHNYYHHKVGYKILTGYYKIAVYTEVNFAYIISFKVLNSNTCVAVNKRYSTLILFKVILF